jgi:hypothetical protein
MKRYKALLFVLLLVVNTIAGASTSGEYGFQMLKIPLSPGVAAMGGTGAYFTGDALSFVHNPVAGLEFMGKIITFSHNSWLFDTRLNSIAYRSSNKLSSFGIAYRVLDYGKFDRRDEIGTEILGEFHPLDLSAIINYAFRISPNHLIGVNMAGLYEKIDTSSAMGISLDVGYLYKTMLRNFHILSALKNIGVTSKMDKEANSLPFTSEISLLKQFHWKEVIISSEVKFIYHIDDANMKTALGTMANLYNIFIVRAGYEVNHDMKDLSAGFGVRLQRFLVDYSYIPTKEDINSVHVVGLSYLF